MNWLILPKMKKRSSAVAIKTVTSRPILLLWAVVSILVAFLCCWSYSQPAWTLRSSSEFGTLEPTPPTVTADPAMRKRVERAVSLIQLPVPDEMDDNSTTVMIPGRSAIPLVHIGLFGMCIYTQQQPERRPESTVTCVAHSDLDYEWLPPAWQVKYKIDSTIIRCEIGSFVDPIYSDVGSTRSTWINVFLFLLFRRWHAFCAEALAWCCCCRPPHRWP